ncbi:MAG: site-specific integrase [Pseudomonadales bacterium]|nr:site-specific integrase [Pseudomonadales bacterium]
MYKIRQRKDSPHWQIDVKVEGFPRVRRSSGTSVKTKAEELARSIENDLWRQSQLGEKREYTWKDAVVKWRKESEHKKSLDIDIYRLRVLTPYLSGRCLTEINRQYIEDMITDLAEERELSNATQNRYISLVRTILRKAATEWDWIDSYPTIRKRKESKRRVRWITPEEAVELLDALPEHHRQPIKLGFATGLRKSNFYYLKWCQIDMQRKCAWVYGDEAKGKKDIAIPLNHTAMEILRGQIGKHDEFVFGVINPPTNPYWKKCITEAGITDFRIHDVRHTWASWHVMNGTSLHELMELGGWSSYDMVLKYAHLSATHLSESAKNVDTNLAQSGKEFLERSLEVA